jgi:hypothetical protein
MECDHVDSLVFRDDLSCLCAVFSYFVYVLVVLYCSLLFEVALQTPRSPLYVENPCFTLAEDRTILRFIVIRRFDTIDYGVFN